MALTLFKLLVRLSGLALTIGAIYAAVFVGMLSGLSINATFWSFIFTFLVSLGLFGPVAVFGLHLTFARWRTRPNRDRPYLIALWSLVATGVVLMIGLDLSTRGDTETATYLTLFGISGLVCTGLIKFRIVS